MKVVPIRLATVFDLPRIDRLANQILSEHGLPRDSAVAELDFRYFEPGGPISQGTAQFWVAQSRDEVVGAAALVPGIGRSSTFKTFYVGAAYRRRGIGLGLYATAERFAKCSGYSQIELHASRRFREAIAFYARNGFELVATLDNLWEDNVYRKTL
jgi:GNAT superfamily N-acetyltransferase